MVDVESQDENQFSRRCLGAKGCFQCVGICHVPVDQCKRLCGLVASWTRAVPKRACAVPVELLTLVESICVCVGPFHPPSRPSSCPSSFNSNSSSWVRTLAYRDTPKVLTLHHRRIRGRKVEVRTLRSHHHGVLRRQLSSLVLRFVKDQFDDYRESTIGGQPPDVAHHSRDS